jgi:hypothetical protein
MDTSGDLIAGAPYPGIRVRLEACGPCAEDFHGLLAAVTGSPE